MQIAQATILATDLSDASSFFTLRFVIAIPDRISLTETVAEESRFSCGGVVGEERKRFMIRPLPGLHLQSVWPWLDRYPRFGERRESV